MQGCNLRAQPRRADRVSLFWTARRITLSLTNWSLPTGMTTHPLTMLLDVNVLLALTWRQHIHHEVAHERFAALDSWSTCSVTESGLLRLLLTEAVVGRRLRGREALDQLAAIRKVSGWSFLPDATSLAEERIDTRVLIGRRQVTDLHLVNLAAHHDVQLVTFDASLKSSLVPADQRWVTVWSA